MAQPRWSLNTATPAAVGTPEAAETSSGGAAWGLRQEQESAARGGGPAWSLNAEPARPGVSWATLTGQNMEGTHNAFDTTFWQTARKQDEEQSSRGMGDRFTRADATGVAIYNDPSKGIVFGDVYLNGMKQGNLREGYAGLTREQGTEMLARMTLPREVWAKAYEHEAGRPLTLTRSVEKELDAFAEESTENYQKGLSASDFEARVAERAAGYEESGAAKAATFGAGAAGGALIGASVGSIIPVVGTAAGAIGGAIVGGLVGGVGAWLNRDEQFRQVAQAAEQYDLATQQGATMVGMADAVAGWAGVAAGTLNPARNLTRGIYDSLGEGGVGDQLSRYNEENAPLGVDILDTAAMVVDGIGSFGSKLAVKAYTATMGVTATSNMTSVGAGVLEGNLAFNPYSGRYEDIGAGMWLKAGSAGIDFAQTATGRVLGRAMASPGGLASYQGGHKITGALGGARSAERLSMSALIPSEAATAMSARMLARRSMRRAGIEPTKANQAREIARHIDILTSGRRSMATTMVNAFGEGTEEFVQATLDALSVGEMPTFRDLIHAARMGAAMGAGMGAAVARNSATRDDQWRAASNVLRTGRGQEVLTDDQWNDLSDSERALEGTARNEDEDRYYKMAVNEVSKLGGKVAAANIPELQRAWEAVHRRVEAEGRNSQDLVEPTRLSVQQSIDWGPQDGVISLTAAMRDVGARRDALAQVARGDKVRRNNGELVEATDELRQYAKAVADTDTALLQIFRATASAVNTAAENGDLTTVRQEIGRLNNTLQEWWFADEAKDPHAFGKRRSVSMLTSRYPLNSAGSFQMLRLQVSPELTLNGANNTALMPNEIQPMMGGDFDGDMTNHMLRMVLPPETYEGMRRGAGQLGSEGVMMPAKTYTVSAAELLFDVLAADPGTPQHKAGQAAVADIRRRLRDVLAKSTMKVADQRRVIDGFMKRLTSRDAEGAFKWMFTELPTRYAGPMRDLAETLDESPWLRMNRDVEIGLRDMATAVALTDFEAVSTTGGVDLPAVSKAMSPYRTKPEKATSELLTGAIETSSWNLFRLATIFKYNAYREATVYTEEEQQLAIAGLYERFTMLNDGIVRSGDRAMFEGTLAQERTLSWLESMAREYHRDMGTRRLGEALVLMASAQVPDVEVGRRALRSSKNVSLAQATLHEVVNGLRREYAEVIGHDESLALRLSSLDSLTVPDTMDGASTKARGGAAFVELLRTRPIVSLLGDDAAHLQSYTVGGLHDKLVSLRADVREQFIDALQKHPQYSQEVDSQGARHTPYRALVDQVVEAARMELHETAKGLADGVRARADQRASADFRSLHDSLRALAVARGASHSTPAEVRAFLESDPQQLGAPVLRLLEDRGLAAGLRQERDADGNLTDIQFPVWLYEVFAEPQTARAEMMLLRNTLWFAKAAMSQSEQLDVDKVSDRILRLWLDLDYRANDETNPRLVLDGAARDAFLELLQSSATVPDFISGLNQDYRFRPENSAPYMAWDRDLATVEDSRFGTGVSSQLEGQEMREALRDAAAAATRGLAMQADAETYVKGNAQVIDTIRASRDEGLDNGEAWKRFERMFNEARQLPVMISTSVTIEMAARINEIVGDMGVKGTAPENVAAMGKMIAAQMSTFDSGLGRLFASATSTSVNSVLTDMTQLARGQRTIVMNDGTVVDWQGIDAAQALDLLSDPTTAGMAARMTGFTAWDLNSETGLASLTSVVGRGVAGFSQDTEAAFFGSDQAAKFRRLMILDAKATTPGSTPTLPVLLAQQMNLRETAVDHVIDPRSDERQQMAVSILEDIADALQHLGSIEGAVNPETGLLTVVTDEVTGDTTTLINRALREAGRRARRASGNLIARMVPSTPGPLREDALEMIRGWLAKAAQRAYESQDAVGLAVSRDLKKQFDRVDDYTSPVELLVDRFKDFTDAATQRQIVSLLTNWGEVSNVVAWARSEILRATSPDTPQVTRTVLDLDTDASATVTLPDMTDAQWETLARATIAFMMHTSYGIQTSSSIQIAEFPSLSKPDELASQLGYWDPSGVSLAMDIFAPGVMTKPDAMPHPLLLAQMELQRDHAPQLPQVTEEQAQRAVYRLLAPVSTSAQDGARTGVIGKWHALLPAMIHSAVGTVMAASASAGISMTGLNPQRMRFFGATTQRDWSQVPTDEELSETTVPISQLVAAVEREVEVDSKIDIELARNNGTAFVRETREGRLIELEGRVARTVSIVAPDGTEHSLLGHPRFATGFRLPTSTGVPAGEAGVVSVETAADAASMWLEDQGIDSGEWGKYSLKMQFFHPATKAGSTVRAAEDAYSHNAWFDGLSGRTEAAYNSPSLMGFLYYGLDGAIPQGYDRALQAMKKLHSALQQVTTMPEAHRRAMMKLGETDMLSMVESITEFMLKQEIDGDRIRPTNYSALRKFVELMYVLRYIDDDGTPHVLSTEQAVARQQAGEMFGPHAEVVGLPMEHILRLMGEQNVADASMASTGMRGFSLSLENAQPYTRFPAEAWTDQMFGGLTAVEMAEDGSGPVGWKSADLLAHAPIRKQALPRMASRYFPRLPGDQVGGKYFAPYRKLQDERLTERANHPQANTRWAEQRERTRMNTILLRESNLTGQALQAVELTLTGRPGDAAMMRAGDRSTDKASHDYTTGWIYRHHGTRSGSAVEGVLITAEEIADRAAMDDVVHIIASDFIREGDHDLTEVFPAARNVLDAIIGTGSTVHIPTSLGTSELTRAMRNYLRERGYEAKEDAADEFVPAIREARSQAEAAYHSRLDAAQYRTSRNRVTVEIADLPAMANENTIFAVNGGLGALENFYQREVIQTARYSGYTTATTREQNLAVVKMLHPLLHTDDGRKYLHEMSGTGRNREARLELDEAIEALITKLEQVNSDPSKTLTPTNGDEFGTGDLVPLVSYNPQGDLVGVHLLRHGHEPVDKAALLGPISGENKALGADGARLTIDKAQVDALHTTHRGVLVNTNWFGREGIVGNIRVRLADLGSKIFEAGTGMKWTTAPPPPGLVVPTATLAAGRPVLGVGDLSSPEAKNSDQEWLNAPDRIVEYVGFDVMPYLVRALTGHAYDSLDSDAYIERSNNVRELLRAFSREHGGSARAADIVRHPNDEYTQALIAQLQERLADLREEAGEDLNLLDNSTQDRLADVTMLRLVLSALSTGAELKETLSTPGYLESDGVSESHTMHPVFTTLLEQLPATHPAKRAYVEQINTRLASKYTETGGDGYYLGNDGHHWIRRVTDSRGRVQQSRTMLSFAELRNADHNEALSEMGQERRQRATISPTTTAMAHVTWGAGALIDETKMRASEMFDEVPLLHGTPDDIARLTFGTGPSAAPFGARMDDDIPMNPVERAHIENVALPARRALSVRIDDTAWYKDMSKQKAATAKREFETLFNKVLGALNLNKGAESIYLTEMIRAAAVRPAMSGRDEGEPLTYNDAMSSLKLIQQNAIRGSWPLHKAPINVISRDALEALRRNGYDLKPGNGKNRNVYTWDAWVDTMLGEAFTDDPEVRRYPATTNVIDGLLHEYRKDIKGLKATVNPQREAILRGVQTSNEIILTSPIVRDRAMAPGAQDGAQIFDTMDYEGTPDMTEDLPQSARAIVEKRMQAWESGNKMPRRRRQSPMAEARRAARERETLARTNVFMRFAQLGLVTKTMANPGLHLSAYLEFLNHAGREGAVSFLAGENLRGQQFTPEQRQLWKDTRDALADNGSFYKMVYENTSYKFNAEGTTRVEAKLQPIVDFTTAAFNDPTWGRRGTNMAQKFMEAAWDTLNKSGTYVSPEQFLQTLAVNPEHLETINPDAVRNGYARVEFTRNLQDNLAERMRRWAVEGVIGSGIPGTNTLGVLLLRFPTMFYRFRTNTLINMAGLQGPHAMLTTLLSERTKRPGGLRDKLTGGGMELDAQTTDTARVEDAVDLTRAILRSGVSYTQLFMVSSMISSFGWGGDDGDDERRMLNKLRRYQHTPVAKDPLALENDFRNAEAWFMDILPAGMGVPSWVLRMFVSPAMGLARFNETGDFRQVYWGFADALGSMPLLNMNTVENAWEAAAELQKAAEAESIEDNVEANANAMRLLITSIGTLESMLFESAFASMIYQAGDEWDRDPYAVVARENGVIRRDEVYNTPLPTTALQDIQDGPRLGQQGYVGHSGTDAIIRGLAENRPMLALVMSMIKRDSTYLRQNMVPKIREATAEELTSDEAQQLIMSIVNNETGREEVTVDGAEAIVRGIQLGTVRADSPALQGVYIPRSMRDEIQTRVLEDMTAKYLERGYTKKDALRSAKAEFYGQAYGEPEGLGFADILWGDVIPEYQNQKYMQLNTTYVMGPNNRPVATGLQRQALAAFGIPMMEPYHAGQTGNLPVDELLNSVDAVRGVNLGMRGLVKVDKSWETPTAEELAERIEAALDKIADKIEDVNDGLGSYPYRNGWTNFGGRGYRRGGGGGGGYGSSYGGVNFIPSYGGMALRIDSQRRVRSPYGDDLYSINTSNPIIRRATIHRQRFSSQRGRLNQWQ